MKRLSIVLLTSLVFCLSLGAESARGGTVPAPEFRESSGIRAQIVDSWLTEEIDRILPYKSTRLTTRLADSFTVKNEIPASGLIAITVAPDERRGVQGVWSLARRASDGLPVSITLYPVSDPRVRVVIRPAADPEKGRSLLDLEAYGLKLVREVPIGLPLVKLYTVSFADIVSLTRATVPWEVLSPDLIRYGNVESAIRVVREGLPNLVYLDDGAFDENYRPVLIETGAAQDPAALLAVLPADKLLTGITGGVNCSGFAKWVVDGIIRPATGSGLKIAPLKVATTAPDTAFTRPWATIRDLFFALDWTRNLASSVVSLYAGRTVLAEASGVDVTAVPFADGTGYLKDVGYPVKELLPILYCLAVREPGHVYLGALSRERGDPPLRQYHHVAALFPYFDQAGNFAVTVFESAAETPIDRFIAANSDAMINLVRVKLPATGYFRP